MSQLCGVLIALTATNSAWAADKVVVLEDGRQIVLHDDFTWEYQAIKTTVLPVEVKSTPIETISAVPIAPATSSITKGATAIPLTQAPKGARIELGTSKNIQQLSNSGIDVLLTAAEYDDGVLVIPTMMTNQSLQSVVTVIVKVALNDENGNQIGSEEAKIWSSIKRLPDTYFRPKTQQKGNPITFTVPEKSVYFISAEIVEVEHW
ncbi:hypothetical protein P3TCK_02701 [Photobacterium profundum 3TCK]|uniref:Uncharacterized protein n=2 Tax=Photobacterium profundum TaxID=74109 RepID=Q1ZB95_9GAMM|nr:hypothetical protein P3TCK_02701 [Photobacterium profundum 3TCK]